MSANRPNQAHQKTRQELTDALRRQLNNLERSFSAFDAGATEEAERIASCIYILCHDGVNVSRSKSLLGMLGFKTGFRVPDTTKQGVMHPSEVRGGPPLLGHFMTETEVSYRALLDAGSHRSARVPFSKWWDEIVFESDRGQHLSRKNLIFFLRSQDGGAHVDDNIRDPAYLSFMKTGNHIAWNKTRTLSVHSDNGNGESKDAHLHSVRQIGWELVQAIKEDERINAALNGQESA